MIILKKDGVFYFCESYWNLPPLFTEDDFTKHEENTHIIRNKDLPHRLIMIDSEVRSADLVRYADIFPARFTPQNLLRQTYPALLSIFGHNDRLNEDESIGFDIAFAKDDKCYVLRPGGVIDEVEEFFPLCNGKAAAISEYIRSKDEPIYRLVQRIYRTIESSSLKIQFPIIVMNTKNNDKKVVTREEDV